MLLFFICVFSIISPGWHFRKSQILESTSLDTFSFFPSFAKFERFIFKKKIKNLSPKTLQNYVDFVTPFLLYVGKDTDISCITTDLVLEYISTLYDRKLADATRATYIRHIKAFLRWLKDCYNISVAMSEIELPKTAKKFVHILSADIPSFYFLRCNVNLTDPDGT